MRLVVIGGSTPITRPIVEGFIRLNQPELVISLGERGLSADAVTLARDLGIPTADYWPDFWRLKAAAVPDAAAQCVRFSKPDLVICLRPRRADPKAVATFRAMGIPCLVGRTTQGRDVKWSA